MPDLTPLKIPVYEVAGTPRPPTVEKAGNAVWLLVRINQILDELNTTLEGLTQADQGNWTAAERQTLTDTLGAIQASVNGNSGRITALESADSTLAASLAAQTSEIQNLKSSDQAIQALISTGQQDATSQGVRLATLESTDQQRSPLLGYAPPSSPGNLLLLKGKLQFPEPQQPSNGTRVLDDYFEFTWTPEVRIGGVTTGITYASRFGIGIKIGKLITIWWAVSLTNKGTATGSVQIAGVPNISDSIPVADAGLHNGSQVTYRLNAAATILDILTASGASLANTGLTNTSTFIGSLQYPSVN
jgi:hypothetical protein